jgi:hypothetical protein
MNFKLIFNSGKTVRPLILTTVPTEVLNQILLSNLTPVEIIGKNEIRPIYGQGQLISDQSNYSLLEPVRLKISQTVADFLMSPSSPKRVEIRIDSIDHQRSSIRFLIDIGLPKPASIASTKIVEKCKTCETHVCKHDCSKCLSHICHLKCTECAELVATTKCANCNTPIDNKKCYTCVTHVCKTESNACTTHECPNSGEDSIRHQDGDTMIAIICSFISRIPSPACANRPITEIFHHWKKRLMKAEPSDNNPTEAWRNIDYLESDHATELAFAMLKCHDNSEQVEITNGQHSSCTLYGECPLIELEVDSLEDNVKGKSLFEYLSLVIQWYFLDIYFTNQPSKIGLNILARLRYEKDFDYKLHPLNLIAQTLSKFDSYSPTVRRPNFGTHHRKGSIASTSSRRSPPGKKLS